MNQLPPPDPLDLTGNLAENFRRFKQSFEIYLVASGLSDKDDKVKANVLLHVIGQECRDIYNGFDWQGNENKEKDEDILKKFEEYCNPRKNVTFERHVFNMRNQKPGESFDSFYSDLRIKSKTCEFGTLCDSLIKDRIVCGVLSEQIRGRLLRDGDLDLKKAIDICRASEASEAQAKSLQEATESRKEEVCYVKQGRPNSEQKKYQKSQYRGRNPNSTFSKDAQNSKRCFYCGKEPHDRKICPARNSTCRSCSTNGHWAVVCRKKSGPSVGSVEADNDIQEAYSDNFLGSVQQEPKDLFLGSVASEDFLNSVEAIVKKDWHVTLLVGNTRIKFKVDTGADVTVISDTLYQSQFSKDLLKQSKRTLRGPDQTSLDVLGYFKAEMKHKGKSLYEDIYVIRNLGVSLLSRHASEGLNIVCFLGEIKEEFALQEDFPRLFSGLGKVKGEYHIKLMEGAQPYSVTTPRRIPLPLMPKVKEELKRLQNLGVIMPVDDPTDWCAPVVVIPKSNGQVRLCVDLTKLNQVVRRERHILPSVEQTLGQMAGAKIFSKLDANSGFHQIPLDKQSTLLTTFITPFGRFCYNRLPFGISSAPEYYQRMMSQVLDGLPGVACLMDDVIIFGTTLEEHDLRLKSTLQRLQTAGITLNTSKCEFRKSQIKFLGQVVGVNGIQPDPNMISAIKDLPEPQNISDICRFLGMVNQLAKFTPNLSEVTKPLRELLSSKNHWIWGSDQTSAFEATKSLLSENPVLSFYDAKLETRVSADASSYGLGVVLCQKHGDGWHPVAFASRSLTVTEQRYAQLEKEALASTWACEKFADYLIGKYFTIETDHKPLISLLGSKALDEMPPRIQRFRMRLMRFQYGISHVPGKELHTADILSRVPIGKPMISDKELVEECDSYVTVVLDSLPVTEARLENIKLHQMHDDVCSEIKKYCEGTWPETHELKGLAKLYFPFRAELSVEDGILLFTSRIVIPQSLRPEILEKIHEGHQGMNKCKERARQSVWWPGIGKQISEFVMSCKICCQNSINHPEPLKPTEMPCRPWQRLGTDLFVFNKQSYLLVVDYYSRYIEIAKLFKTTSLGGIQHMKSIFGRHGIPEILISDNGPQYSADEFASFVREYGITHLTSSPGHSSGNGLAERSVKTVKALLHGSKDPYIALLNYRATPLANGYSPSELLMNRKLRTKLPVMPITLHSTVPNPNDLKEYETQYRAKQKSNFDKRHAAKPLPLLREGDEVYVPDREEFGVVEKQVHDRSYEVSTPSGSFRRNSTQMNRYKQPDKSILAQPTEVQNTEELVQKQEASVKLPKPLVTHTETHSQATSSSQIITRSGRISKPNPKYTD